MGRPKGSPNKTTLKVTAQETAERMGFNLFEALIYFAKGDWKSLGYKNEVYVMETASGEHKLGYTITPAMRLEAIKTACKYIYSPMQPVNEQGSTAVQVTVTDLLSK